MLRLAVVSLSVLALGCGATPAPPGGGSPDGGGALLDGPIGGGPTGGGPNADAPPARADARPDLPPWRWGPVQKDDCTGPGLRQISAPLRNVPAGMSAEVACHNGPKNVMGIDFARPDRCIADGMGGFRGEWDVPDSSCAATAPPAPTRGGEGERASPAPLEGYADLHLHQMAHLGFSGSVVWGAAFGPPAEVLLPIPDAMKAGHDRSEALFDGNIVGGLTGTSTHEESGYPTFTSWPNREIASHQQAYEDWLFRAYQGGLRLMVMLAVNSEDMFGRGENDLGNLGLVSIQPVRVAGRTGNDMETLEWQVREAYRMQTHVDTLNGGPGRGWYRIVRDPVEAGATIAQGKMAVILGTELQHLFNCDVDRPACTNDTITEGLDRLEAMGVNYVFPVHHKLNQFGGPTQFNLLTNGPTRECWETQEPCSDAGLSPLGRFLVEELSARGMLVDTEHMSWKTFEDTMDIAEARAYPVLAGHIGSFDLRADAGQTEHMRKTDQIRRILDVGGMLGVILGVTNEEYARSKTSPVPLPKSCGGADDWANTYLYMRELARGGLGPQGAGRITVGSDWNGFSGWPGPRYAATPCTPPTARDGKPIPKPGPVAYPFTLPSGLVPAAIGGPSATMPRFEQFHPWDYNALGLMHAGLMPDFFEDLRMMGLTVADLEPVYRSARGVVDLWRTARDLEVPGDRHRVRWVPQNQFDLLAFDVSDPGRNVEAAPGSPLCRRRGTHLLGIEQNGICQLVEPAPVPLLSGTLPAVAISAYHAGRCLEVDRSSSLDGARVQQFPCNGGDNQRWTLRGSMDAGWELVNAGSAKCLDGQTMISVLNLLGGQSVIQRACSGAIGQRWKTVRTGNTFSLRSDTGMCLEVSGQSRFDGAAVEPAPCTGAANQQWSIESLRTGDHERLYQADKDRIAWLAAADAAHPIPVTVDGTRPVCRSAGWAGVVSGNECIGRTAAGAPASSTTFERLLQAR